MHPIKRQCCLYALSLALGLYGLVHRLLAGQYEWVGINLGIIAIALDGFYKMRKDGFL